MDINDWAFFRYTNEQLELVINYIKKEINEIEINQ